tara:strand:- start:249 stop:596 length:348 start_codon:yes stop_codon:yes gene_type:complete
MPHIVIEYAQNIDTHLDVNGLVNAIHEAALRSDLFEPEAIKVRAIAYHHYLVAGEVADFIHLRVQILSGRSEQQKKHLSQCMLEGVETLAVSVPNVTVEVIDMDRFSYAKGASPG